MFCEEANDKILVDVDEVDAGDVFMTGDGDIVFSCSNSKGQPCFFFPEQGDVFTVAELKRENELPEKLYYTQGVVQVSNQEIVETDSENTDAQLLSEVQPR